MSWNRASNIAVWISLALLMFVLWLLFAPVKVADYNQPYKIHPSKVEAGQTIYYTADYCKYKNYTASVSRLLIDGTVISLPSDTTNLPTGCNKKDIPITIPKNAPPGIYHLEINLIYKINPLRNKMYRITTETFEVTNVCLTDQGCK